MNSINKPISFFKLGRLPQTTLRYFMGLFDLSCNIVQQIIWILKQAHENAT